MNTVGIHALVWVPDWSPASAREAIALTARTGYDLIEIPVLDPQEIDTAATREQLQDAGLQAACSLGLTPQTDVSSADPVTVKRGREDLARALEVAVNIGASHLCGVLYSSLGKYGQPRSPEGMENAAEAMGWLAREAASAGVEVALEVVNRYESNVVNTAAEMLAFIDSTGADIGLHLDTYHMNIEESDFATPVYKSASRIKYVHVGESHRGALGTGTIDFVSFFGALRAVKYNGPITFESFSSAVVHPTLSATLGIWRNLWTDNRALARDALQFVRRGMSPSSESR